jgi:hypothetical protein
VTVVHPTQIEAEIRSTNCYGGSGGAGQGEEEDNLLTIARAIPTILRGMKKLKDMCFRDLTTVLPGISLSNFKHHWESFWEVYHNDVYRPTREMLEGAKEVDLEVLMKGESGTMIGQDRKRVVGHVSDRPWHFGQLWNGDEQSNQRTHSNW